MLKAERMAEQGRGEAEIDVARRPRNGLRIVPERRAQAIRIIESESHAAHRGREKLHVTGFDRERVLALSRDRLRRLFDGVGARRRREQRCCN